MRADIVQTKEHMRVLIDELNKACSAYYNQGIEIMSNFRYDSKIKELEELEQRSGFRYDDSPTNKVGSPIPTKVSVLGKVKHEFPAKSLDKTKDIDKLIEVFEEAQGLYKTDKVVLMWKLDGSTIQLTYQDGKLVSAATRGNGEVGQNITHNAPYIKGIPTRISAKGRLTVRGEGTMSYLEFERINSLIPDTEDKYMNPRNLAAASIKLLDSADLKDREIYFNAFEVVNYSEDCSNSFFGRLKWLESLGFNVVSRSLIPITLLRYEIEKWTEKSQTYSKPVDGLVIAYDDCGITDKLEGTEHHPNALKGYAFKWKDETAETILREIEWSPSRTGLLNPVAIFDSVSLEGTTVSRASIHNFSIMRGLHLRIGDKISVYKANKIIPQIAENLSDNELPYTKEDEENIIGVCPHCGTRGKIFLSKEEIESVYCVNSTCPAKLIFKFEHFCNRNGMNIEGLSEETITKFVAAGYLKGFSDLFTLDRFKQAIISTPGFGERSWEKLWSSIQNSRHTSFIPFITALGIPDVGYGQAKLLAKEFDYDVEKFFYSPYTNLTHIKGIGDILSDGIMKWRKENVINSKEDYEETEVTRLLDYITIDKPEIKENLNKFFEGKTFVVTGKVNKFPNRDAIHKFIEDNGGKTSGSVTSKTSYLVNNDVTSTSGKNKKAKELNIPIISEEDLLNMIE